ncbi:protein SENSITIVE TO UV 2 [Punica granatum]|uniref:Protein SENSITIVE TO UV 2 n=1 Tax=Punica granatum TaxID=22663 RepID=A0A6P8D875_PUNGR|nr:protein SENSITIVE TO UV 2 [Punica granatum]
MDDEGGEFEEWDADFLEQVIQVEERALSCSSSSASQRLPPPPPPPTSNPSVLSSSYYLPPQPPPSQPLPHHSRLYAPPSYSNAAPPQPPPPISYSPPRELSQRPVDHRKPSSHQPPNGHAFAAPTPSSRVASSTDIAKELEIERLKKELARVSKQLSSREHECAELRKEREKKEEQLKSAFSHSQRKVPNDCSLDDIRQCSREVDNVKLPATSKSNLASTHKAIGVQTEKAVEATCQIQRDNDRHAHQNLSTKLLFLWGPPFDKVGNGIVSKLFVPCYGLFRCIGADVSSKMKLDSVADETLCDLGSQSLTASDASKVSRFYSVLVKVSDGVAQLEALLEPLVDLCVLDNVVLLQRSLCILHLILKHLLGMERKVEPRDNIKIEGPLPRDDIAGINGSDSARTEFPLSVNLDEAFMVPDTPIGFRSSGAGSQLRNGQWICGRIETISSVFWLSLFELLNNIIKKSKEESIRLEAVSIMNLILLRSSSYEEREKFQLQMVLESISVLLKKEHGSRVPKQALHLLFLLLNCPKTLDKFCSDSKDGGYPCSVNIILQGLAGCIRSCGSAIEDLQLRRKAIMLLAFLASSGTAGFEILTNHQLPNGVNFLMLILQALLSELDAEAAVSPKSPEILKERTLIMREGLILLDRLVSNPLYASTCLRALTTSRDMLSLTIDVANRMSQKQPRFGQFESTNKLTRESEVVDLARTFKKRVFTYLGDIIL